MTRDESVLASVRRALRIGGAEAPRIANALDRLTSRPASYAAPHESLFSRFVSAAEAAATTIAALPHVDDVPFHVAELLKEGAEAAAVTLGSDARLTSMPWLEAGIETRPSSTRGAETCAVSHALAACAETGAVALISGAANPTSLNFLPELHIAVVDAQDIVAGFEELWRRLRASAGASMPRCVNLINGPSRSADIEQTTLFGAHGPRRFHVIIIGSNG